jgi:hypothetical protein
VEWYEKREKEMATGTNVMWGVGENIRFAEPFVFAAEMASGMGRLLQFQVRVHKFTRDDGKYYRKFSFPQPNPTELFFERRWRKKERPFC